MCSSSSSSRGALQSCSGSCGQHLRWRAELPLPILEFRLRWRPRTRRRGFGGRRGSGSTLIASTMSTRHRTGAP
ncbi:hypothetical protein MTO96_008046 [Rhipicephalus appendiculatus]